MKSTAAALAAMAMIGGMTAPLPGTMARAGATTLDAQAHAEHMLRRFAFSAPPSDVAAIADVSGGDLAWLHEQLNPDLIDDTGSTLEAPTTKLDAQGNYPDWFIYERIMLQHWILTKRQAQAKLELHWLDHFSVGIDKVGDPAVMANYDLTIRRNALGNFITLATAVATSPAMLEWLDNNGNIGPVANENFARECMQLFIMGPYALNQDGTVKTDASGNPIANYSQADVQAIALAMTGYEVDWNWAGTNPETRFATVYAPDRHDTRQLKFRGKTYKVPNSAEAMRYVIDILARNPSTAPFQAKELLQRFVTENPSKQYVSDIAAVWAATIGDSNQIAEVVHAIVTHPEFDGAYHAMPKQPVEIMVDMMRALPGAMQSIGGNGPGQSLLWALTDLAQEPYNPPSVFSFYRPGDVETTINTSTRLSRNSYLGWITGLAPTDQSAMAYIDVTKLRQRAGSNQTAPIVRYLLNALLDGGSTDLKAILTTYLDASTSGPGGGPGDNELRGAIWLVLNSPEYAVN